MPEPVIREAVAADATAIGSVHVASWRVAYAGHVSDDVLSGLSILDRARQWEEVLGAAEPRGTVVVLESAGWLGGFAAFGSALEDSGGQLYALYVDPQQWGRGWGRLLLDEAVTRLASAGHAEAVLWVLDTNTRARTFYERAGWKPDGATKTEELHGAVLPTVRYRRPLP
ncbi:GNAT family N-acetyltransferase [Amycolatopsis sp. NPDC059027]|uniref:GNAT family N-acetyltransferase n=1 Tax=unclassified Amycolatopsis TaxID=2618356 RepID=UPI00366B7DC4